MERGSGKQPNKSVTNRLAVDEIAARWLSSYEHSFSNSFAQAWATWQEMLHNPVEDSMANGFLVDQDCLSLVKCRT